MARKSGIVKSETLRLGQFLKWTGVVGTGGEAKALIQDGRVLVNGEVELRRGRQLQAGDRVEVEGQHLLVPENLTGPNQDRS